MSEYEAPGRSADVIVVGAGPAGAVTALLLARAGIDVLLLDRAPFPRPKPCGDCLSLGAGTVLERLGLLEDVLGTPHGPLRGWRIVAPDGAAFEADFGRARAPRNASTAIAIERALFDDVLVRAARAAGAVLERATVTDLLRDDRGAVTGVMTRSGAFRARVTIGADGLRSVIAARLGARGTPGRRRKLSLTLHVDLPGTPDRGEMHVADGICVGLARIDPNGRCNLTVVADAARYGRAVAHDPRAFARTAIAAMPRLRSRIDPDVTLAAPILASGPFDRPVRRIAYDGAALVGDAAGYFDPFTGQGVFQALVSAEMLAAAVTSALAADDTSAAAFRGYVRARTAVVSGARTIQHGIELVLSRPAFASRAIRRIQRAPVFAQTLLAVTGDTLLPRALLSPRGLAGLLIPARPMEDAA